MLDTCRVRNSLLLDRIVSPEEAASLIRNHDHVGISGFTPSGYPKKTTIALAEQIKQGRLCKVSLWTGASVGPEVEDALAAVDGVEGRMPYYAASNTHMREGINNGEIAYVDLHLSQFAQQIDENFYGPVDVAIVEVVAITENGGLVLGPGIGNTPILVKNAKKIIVEVNTSIPLQLEGIHDNVIVSRPPFRREVPIYKVSDRIGSPVLECGIDRITCIVESDVLDNVRNLKAPDATTIKIADNLIAFLEEEQRKGRLPDPLLPIQSGVGAIANAVLLGLAKSSFTHFEMYSEVLQDSVFTLIKSGKVDMASGCAFTPSPNVWDLYNENPDLYNAHIVLRPLDISNHPEVIRRLGVIALNTPIEFDIYGQANSTHIMGNTMMNGIGGSGDYMRNGYLTIFTTPSTAGKNGEISKIVPMCSHVDHTEHDTMVFVTEQGVADVRGLAPLERAQKIIENCAHPNYKEELFEYLENAKKGGGHMPVDLLTAFSMHERYLTTGSMKK